MQRKNIRKLQKGVDIIKLLRWLPFGIAVFLYPTIAGAETTVNTTLTYPLVPDGIPAGAEGEIGMTFDVITVSDDIKLQLKPSLNTNTEVSLSLLANFNVIEDKIDLWAGVGGAYRMNSDNMGTITGISEEVNMYGVVGATYWLNPVSGMFVEYKHPFADKQLQTEQLGFGLSLKI